MLLKRCWEEDETKKAERREKKQEDLFTLQDAAWEARLIKDDCRSFVLSLEKRIARLDDLIERRGQDIDQESQGLNDS